MSSLADPAVRHHDEIIPHLLTNKYAAPPEYLHGLGVVKRFLERWCADENFRARCELDARAAAEEYGIDVDPEEIRATWDQEYALGRPEGWTAPLIVRRYRAFCQEKVQHREQLRTHDCEPAHPAYKAWRRRQLARSWGVFSPSRARAIIHAPCAFELNVGCSVGCWFCGVGAEKFRESFLYTPENARLWNGVVLAMKKVIGPAAGQGFCYWATDPLDNKDYEKFLVDFHRITGRCPQTTTAQPAKDIERTRALLKLSEALGTEVNRFSILSRPIFDKILGSFTPEELLYVELVNQNKEATSFQTRAGRARASYDSRAQGREVPDEESGTIACVSGFIVNMVEKWVRLISPTGSNERWPLGYWVFDEQAFGDAAEFEQIIRKMIETHMSPVVRAGMRVKFRPDLTLTPVEQDGFQLASRWLTLTFRKETVPMQRLGEIVVNEQPQAGELALRLEAEFGTPIELTFRALNLLFKHGVIDEEPPVRTVRARL